jgi:AraC family ethanolamine operon transcriptional activator
MWSFSDPDGFAAAVRSASVEYLSLAPRPAERAYEASLAVVDLSSVTIQHAEDEAHLVRAATLPDRLVLLFPAGPTVPGLLMNGHEIGAEDVILLGPRAELRGIAPGPLAWASVALDLEADLLDGALVPGEARSTVLTGLGTRSTVLVAAAAAMRELARSDPQRLGRGTVTAALTEAWSATVAAVLSPPPAVGRAGGQRLRLVLSAEAWLDANVGRSVYTEELATALGVGQRTLHDAFLAVFGMSVHRYLRSRRLNLVRAALRSGGDGSGLIKSVALGHGFWHLGRFAVEYQAMFGERPSETLAAARRATTP